MQHCVLYLIKYETLLNTHNTDKILDIFWNTYTNLMFFFDRASQYRIISSTNFNAQISAQKIVH